MPDAFSDVLKREGLQPAEGQPVAALFELRMGQREHLCGLYRRSDALPLHDQAPT